MNYSVEEQLKRNIRSEKCQKYFDDYTNGNIILPKPIWHLNEEDIDLDLQNDKMVKNLSKDGFTIIKNVAFKSILNNLEEGDKEGIEKFVLFTENYPDHTICQIIDEWNDNIKLIPPTITIFDEEYSIRLSKDFQTTKEFRIIDGKHRLKIAYALKEVNIPILVYNWQVEKIKKLLEL